MLFEKKRGNGLKRMDRRDIGGVSTERSVRLSRLGEEGKLREVIIMLKTSMIIELKHKKSINFDQRFIKKIRELCDDERVANEI